MEIVTLEDSKDYLILDILEIEKINYVYLASVTEKENKQVCIRKIEENEEYLVGLDTEEEYKRALNAYITKYRNIVSAA